MPKNVQTTTQLHSYHTLAKWCSKFSKQGFNYMWTENFQMFKLNSEKAAAAAAKPLQSCPTLCDPIDSGPPGSAVPGILQARTLEWVAISFSSACKWKVKVKSLSPVWLLATPWTEEQSMGFSRQEYWSGVRLPSPQKRQRNQRSNCQHLLDHRKNRNSRKISTSALLTTPKPLTMWITTNSSKFFRRWEYQTNSPVSWEICMQVEKQQLEPDMEQWTCSKLGKDYIKAANCHPELMLLW